MMQMQGTTSKVTKVIAESAMHRLSRATSVEVDVSGTKIEIEEEEFAGALDGIMVSHERICLALVEACAEEVRREWSFV